MAAYATVDGEQLTLKGMYVTDANEIYFDTVTGSRQQGERLGAELADRMRRMYH